MTTADCLSSGNDTSQWYSWRYVFSCFTEWPRYVYCMRSIPLLIGRGPVFMKGVDRGFRIQRQHCCTAYTPGIQWKLCRDMSCREGRSDQDSKVEPKTMPRPPRPMPASRS